MKNLNHIPRYTFDGWGALALVAGFIPSILIAGILSVIAMEQGIKIDELPLFTVITTAIMWLGAIMSFDFFICRKQTGMPIRFHLKMSGLKITLLSLPLMIGTMLISEFFISRLPTTGKFWEDWYQKYEQMMEFATSTPWAMAFLGIIIAPIFEEIVFRGIIMKGLTNKGVHPWKAIIFSALLFGIIHGNPWQFLGASVIGLVLGYIYWQSETLLLPILLHAFNNALVICLFYITGKENFSDIFQLSPIILLFIGIMLAVIGGWGMRKFNYRRKDITS